MPVEDVTTKNEKENGIIGRTALLKQIRAARSIIEGHNPEKLVIYGGDCLTGQVPYSYLNEKYHTDGKVGMLWLDAHYDLATPDENEYGHAHVLTNILGKGDKEFVKDVKVPFNPENVLNVGISNTNGPQEDRVKEFGITCILQRKNT